MTPHPTLENAVTTTSSDTDSLIVDHRDPQVRLRALFDRGTLRLLIPTRAAHRAAV